MISKKVSAYQQFAQKVFDKSLPIDNKEIQELIYNSLETWASFMPGDHFDACGKIMFGYESTCDCGFEANENMLDAWLEYFEKGPNQ